MTQDETSSPPEIIEQWAVIDKWWTDEPEKRVYIEVLYRGKKCVLRYDLVSEEFIIEPKSRVPEVSKDE